MNNAVCTIVSKNYFAYAQTLIQSYLTHHPEHAAYILVVDDASERELFTCVGATVLFLEDIQIPAWRKVAFKFDIMELNTNVKPSCLSFLLAKSHEVVIYLDPDIFVYQPLTPVFESLLQANVVLTPHAMTPLPEDGRRLLDRDLLKCGVYNLGFIGVRSGPETSRFLDWWAERCLSQGFNEPSMGWFVDQHWLDLAPCYFDGVHILKHPGCNVAYWNLHERYVAIVEDQLRVNHDHALIFFHYSGIDAFNLEALSKHQNRYDLAARPDIRKLMESYAAILISNGHADFRKIPYGFGMFASGRVISPVLRRYYSELSYLQIDDDPFKEGSSAFVFANRYGIYPRSAPVSSTGAVNSLTLGNQSQTRLRMVGVLFRLLLRALGPQRYELFCKAMRHFGVFNNQAKPMFDRRLSGE